MIIDINEMVTASEAARMLGVTRLTVHRMIERRDLFAHKLGPKTVVIRRQDVEWLKRRLAK
jgi:excisionase family DNA binding protein